MPTPFAATDAHDTLHSALNDSPPVASGGGRSDVTFQRTTRVLNAIILLIALTLLPGAYAQAAEPLPTCVKEPEKRNQTLFAVEAALIPVLVLLSGTLAGLTLGYLSLDSE